MTARGDTQAWETGWRGHERAQGRRLAALSLSERLDWLEEADAIVAHLRRQAPPSHRERAPRDQPVAEAKD